jgi:hypothetical protein
MVQPMLLSFAGEDALLGRGLNLRKHNPILWQVNLAKRGAKGGLKMLKKTAHALRGDALGLTPEAAYYYGLMGEEYLGKGKFLPGLTKAIKKVGKVTSPFTTAIANSFLPSGVVNAFAKVDPTKKGSVSIPVAVQQAQKELQKASGLTIPSEASVKANALMKTLTNPMVLGIAGGGILLLVLMSKKRK